MGGLVQWVFIRYLELKYKQIQGWSLPWRHVERSKMIGPWNKNYVCAQDYRLGPEWTSDPNFKFQMFSNDILSDIIVIKVVTEKTVRNLNLNFKFLSNGNFRWWAFRNYAYFVMKPSGCDTVRLRVWPLHLRWFESFSHVVALEIFKFEFWVQKSVQIDLAWPCGHFAVLFVYYIAI